MADISVISILPEVASFHAVSFDVFRSLSEYELATSFFDEKTCEIAMCTYSGIFSSKRNFHLIDFCHLTVSFMTS